MRALLRTATSLYLVLTVIVGVPASAGRPVLCVAPNGHVAIEAEVGCCMGFASRQGIAPDQGGCEVLPEICGDCVDIPVGIPALTVANGRGRISGLPTYVANPQLSSALSVNSFSALTRMTPIPQAALRSPILSSRTTILRI